MVILGYVLLSWLNLYIVFSGYSDIAIGSSRLFGINVRENFNLPFLATNIQKYWQRWNISIMNFVSEYIYINFVRVTGKRVFGIFIAFFFMGMWHNVSWRSCDLGTWAFASNDNIFLLRRTKFASSFDGVCVNSPVVKLLRSSVGWCLTMILVSLLSMISVSSDFETGIAFLLTFIK